jgi:CMP-2-keto-3-deoxyoctulosonic acid synthetase
VRVDSDAVSVDTEEDLDNVRNAMISDSIFKKYGGSL